MTNNSHQDSSSGAPSNASVASTSKPRARKFEVYRDVSEISRALQHVSTSEKPRYPRRVDITHLPSELLAMVFLHHLFNWRFLRLESVHTSPLHWTCVLLVSRLWHDTAMSTPALWTFIEPAHPALIELSLLRCGKLPLELLYTRLDLNEAKAIEAYIATFPHLHRVRVLELHLRPDIADFLEASEWKNLHAPLLEHIALKGGRLDDGELPFLATMKMPRLRRLSVSWSDGIPLQEIVRGTLTSVELHQFTYPLAKLLETLRRLPALRELTLCGYDTPEATLAPHPDPVVLSKLKVFIFDDRGIGPSRLFVLDYLRIPAAASVGLSFNETATWKRWKRNYVPVLRSIAERVLVPSQRLFMDAMTEPSFSPKDVRRSVDGEGKPLRSIRLDFSPDADGIVLLAGMWTDTLSLYDQLGQVYPSTARLALRMSLWPRAVEVVGEQLFAPQINFHSVTSLAFAMDHHALPAPLWTTVIAALPNLETLCVEGDAIKAFIDMPLLSSSQDGTAAQLLCSSLKRLGLASAVFAKCPSRIVEDDTVTALAATFKRLRAHGLQLQVIQIVDAQNLSKKGMELLWEAACAGVFEVSDSWFECMDESCREGHGASEGPPEPVL